MKFKWMTLLLAVVLVFASAGSALAAADEGKQSWEVSVGKETNDGVSIDSMFPGVVYVHEGDTVTFTNGAVETPHTVTFLSGADPLTPENPEALMPAQKRSVEWDGKLLLNSGMMMPGEAYTVTFTAAGAFPYYCILHPMMRGTVVVVPKGAAIPSKEQQAITANMQLADLKAQAETLKMAHQHEGHMKNADGTVTYSIALGAGHSGFSINKMLPETVFISEGDTVEWANINQYEPHWVTFNKPDDMSFFGPHGEFNPAFMAPAGGTSFDGTGFVNSGMVNAGQSYKLTFTKAGTYTYECYLHSGSKMVGTIVVAPKGSAKVIVNGKLLQYDGKLPFVKGHDVVAAIVPFAEALGGTAVWNKSVNAVNVNVGGTFGLPGGLIKGNALRAYVNGKALWSTQSVAGRSFASLQELVSSLGGSYSWDEETQTFSAWIK